MSSGIININNQPSIGGLSVKYGDFGQADSELTSKLPSSVNLGLTSPGFLDNASECTGVDFINNNPSYEQVTFSQCLDKFQDQFMIPQQGFASLMHNLPYTFSVLDNKDKEYYINELKTFINRVENKDKKITDKNKKSKNVENFKNDNLNGNSNDNSNEMNDSCKKVPNYEINCVLVMIILILLGIIGYNLYNQTKLS